MYNNAVGILHLDSLQNLTSNVVCIENCSVGEDSLDQVSPHTVTDEARSRRCDQSFDNLVTGSVTTCCHQVTSSIRVGANQQFEHEFVQQFSPLGVTSFSEKAFDLLDSGDKCPGGIAIGVFVNWFDVEDKPVHNLGHGGIIIARLDKSLNCVNSKVVVNNTTKVLGDIFDEEIERRMMSPMRKEGLDEEGS